MHRLVRVLVALILVPVGCASSGLSREDIDARLARTRSRIIVIMTALENYAAANGRYPRAGADATPCTPEPRPRRDTSPRVWPPTRTIEGVRPYLEPAFVDELPLLDGWDHLFRVEVSGDGCDYTIASLGSDGKLDKEFRSSWKKRETYRDLVLSNGSYRSACEEMAGR